MYHPHNSSSQYSSSNNEHANAITPSTWFVNFYIFKPIEDTSFLSELELLFLLDSGASICVLNLSILYNVILTIHTSIHGSTCTLILLFAVANIKYDILGTPLF